MSRILNSDSTRISKIRGKLAAWVVFVCLSKCSLLHADITSYTGAVKVLSAPPANVVGGKFESDTDINVFKERAAAVVGGDVQLSLSIPGIYNESNPNDTPYTIPAGTKVASYYVHFDKVGSNNTVVVADGSLTFSDAIIGVIIKTGLLKDTHALLGAPQTAYPTGNSQGIELKNDPNVVTLSSDRHTLTLHLAVTCCVDTVRIITGDIADAPGGNNNPGGPTGGDGGGVGGVDPNDMRDSDNDGVPNNQDGCPFDANKQSPGSCGCGFSEGDCNPNPLVLTTNFCGVGGAGLMPLMIMMGFLARARNARLLRRPA